MYITKKTNNGKLVAVIKPKDNQIHATQSVIPQRFNSTSKVTKVSLISDELGSISRIKKCEDLVFG